MEPSDQQLLIERISHTLIFLCSIAAVIWFIPDWVRSYQPPALEVQEQTEKKVEQSFDLGGEHLLNNSSESKISASKQSAMWGGWGGRLSQLLDMPTRLCTQIR